MSPQREHASADAGNVGQWLEQELEQTKTHLRKLDSQVEQALAQVWDIANAVRRAEDTAGAFAVAASSVNSLQEEMRQVKELVGRLQDRQGELATRTGESIRQRQSEVEHEHNERAVLSRQIETFDKVMSAYEGRLQALGEAVRHMEEETSSIRQAHLGMSRQVEDVLLKLAHNQEALSRLSNVSEKLTLEAETLQKQDENLSERLRLQQEVVRRTEERVDQVSRYLELPQAIVEQQERVGVEIGRMAERLGVLERALEESIQHTTDLIQGMTLLDQRVQTHTGRLLSMSQDMETQRDQVREQFARMIRTLERQRRRQVEALTQEIKEIRQSDINNTGQ